MSARVCSKIWALKLDPVEKLVLLALGDYGNDQGEEIYPGYGTLAAKTGLTERTIINKIQSLIQAGLLIRKTVPVGRGNRQEFTLTLPGKGESNSPISEPENQSSGNKKGEFDDIEKVKDVHPLKTERVNLVQKRVNLTTQKGEFDDIALNKDRARVLTLHEPLREPILTEKPKASRQPVIEYEIFCRIHLESRRVPYVNKQADFVHLANLKKKLVEQDWELTAEKWETAVRNYFSSEIATFTLADLANRFATFFAAQVDRFGKPIKTVPDRNANGQRRVEF